MAKSDDDSDAFIESFTPASGDRTNIGRLRLRIRRIREWQGLRP